MRKRLVFPAVATLLFAVTAFAHPEGVVRLSAKQVEAGAGLGLRGEKMPKAATVKLELRGTLVTLSLGELKTDTAGVFESSIVVPETAEPGNYTLVVVAADGDVLARSDVAILAAAPAPATEDHAAMGHDEMVATEATDEMMPLDVRFSTAEMSVIGVLMLAGLAGGLALLRRPRSA
jgi:hypothetical protein